ncbi:hypothetical protein EYW98_01265 [Escherichia coli]|uniref:hypothetical protein n=1 Tax=Escherichia sp. MOD1-EC7003 TaxID=2093900 RepID=UPI000CF7593C|nr:hypothetical protein [Escherichia sp. MOD1-EC7003]EGO8358179.1 hypothetical protein [Escherichia coli]EGO8376383.1 hypothetical protein [Escherichia coli]MCH0695001.1 hypothetical protein [Escherichia coli]
MNVSKGSMWNNGEKVRLSHLLDKVPANKWDWYLYEIEAIGIAPRDMSMPDFEQRVLSSDTGFKLSWDEVKYFFNSLSDIKNCFLAALVKSVKYSALDNGDLSHCLALITISDSTSWEVKLMKDNY